MYFSNPILKPAGERKFTVVGNATARFETSEHYVSTKSRLEKPTVWYPQCLSLLRSAIQARVSFSDSDIISPTAKAVRGVSSLSLLLLSTSKALLTWQSFRLLLMQELPHQALLSKLLGGPP